MTKRRGGRKHTETATTTWTAGGVTTRAAAAGTATTTKRRGKRAGPKTTPAKRTWTTNTGQSNYYDNATKCDNDDKNDDDGARKGGTRKSTKLLAKSEGTHKGPQTTLHCTPNCHDDQNIIRIQGYRKLKLQNCHIVPNARSVKRGLHDQLSMPQRAVLGATVSTHFEAYLQRSS